MKKTGISNMTDRQVMKIAEQLRTAYMLKKTLRYNSTRNLKQHSESVAEHVFALFFLAEYFLSVEKIPKTFDVKKLHRILLFHDFGEILHGDVPTHEKNDSHIARERRAAKKVFSTLPQPFGKQAYLDWKEYEFKKSPEAHFANAVDKIEPVFELLDPINAQTLKRMKTTYELHLPKKLKATENFPVMRRFVEVMSQDMLKRGLFWKK